MKRLFPLMIVLFILYAPNAGSQTNEFLDNPLALDILTGRYDPAQYHTQELADEAVVMQELVDGADRRRLIDLLLYLDTFYNRNTGSDTTSLHTGIGACREWIKASFDEVSRNHNDRLITGFLEFDADVCGMSHHKNPFAILPGSDTSLNEVIVLEGHFDTRNEDACDTEGYTPGSDDNGSGTILVMEAARLLAPYSFPRTILFTTPTGEDQGLWGAKAWANFLTDQGIQVVACLNNDIVGGITCGRTSSPPSCPYEGHVDSTHVRVFSYSSGNSSRTYSPHKQLARLIKLIQEEHLNPLLESPMTINIMAAEDRTGRSGDHIPFRQKGIPAIRFCSANEHGNGRGDYPDRIHSGRDVLGLDENGDGFPDTLFVDPGYLSRNIIINCATAAHLAAAPKDPEISFIPVPSGVRIQVSSPDPSISHYRIGVRYLANRSHEFDALHRVDASDDWTVEVDASSRSYISVAAVSSGYTGMFGMEYELNLMSADHFDLTHSCRIQSVYPNPAEDRVHFDLMSGLAHAGEYVLSISDLSGRVITQQAFRPEPGQNQISVPVNELRPGFYLARVRHQAMESVPVRFLKLANN